MKNLLRLAGCWILLIALTACTASKPDRMDLSGIEIEKRAAGGVSITRVDISQMGDSLIVSGTLRRLHEVKIPGHIDIVIFGPEGPMEKYALAVPGLSSNRKGAMNLPFRARLNTVPPAGSKVILRYHAPASESLAHSICAAGSQPGPGKNDRFLLAKLTLPRPQGN